MLKNLNLKNHENEHYHDDNFMFTPSSNVWINVKKISYIKNFLGEEGIEKCIVYFENNSKLSFNFSDKEFFKRLKMDKNNHEISDYLLLE